MASYTVDISDSGFMELGAITVGDVVRWKNEDSVTHSVTSDDSSDFAFDTGKIRPGLVSKSVTFTQEGSFAYHCKIHPEMKASISVQGNDG